MAEPAGQQNTTSPSWRIRVCRAGWKVLLYVWGTLITGIIVGTIANLNTTPADTPLANLFIIHLAMTWPLPVVSGLGILITLTGLFWFCRREHTTTPQHILTEQDRKYMLRRLRFRYEQMLEQSLQGVIQMDLGLASRSAAVQNAASLVLRLPNQSDQLLPHTSIVQAYDLAQRELLILGEPGAGKPTLLLELAYHLVELAEQDATQPLPILLPLSSWATKRPPLHDWLVEQVALLYGVSEGLSQQWLQGEQLLPLLDGLDEVEASQRVACIAAINTYHHEHLQSLVVCSRTDEYEAAATKVRFTLHSAVVVQPLSREQVDTHLMNMGKPLEALHTAFRKNAVLRELATTPLILQVLMLTYHGTLVRELSQKEAQLRKQIWDDYVQRMVSRKGDARRYPLRRSIAWLVWLARQMRLHNQTIFYLEQLQPDWLPKKPRVLYQWSIGLVGGLIGGLVGGLIFGLGRGLIGGLVFGLIFGLASGLISGLGGGLSFGLSSALGGELERSIQPTEVLTWPWKSARRELLAGGLISGLVGGLAGGLVGGLTWGLTWGLSFVLVFVLFFARFFRFSRNQLVERLHLSPNEGIQRSLKNGLLLLGGGLISGLIFGLSSGLTWGLISGLIFGLSFGLIWGLDAAVQHYILRFWLSRSHTFPWHAPRFLEDATARILLRRVGGGYQFTHRLLLDYFADLDAYPSQPSTAESSTPSPTP